MEQRIADTLVRYPWLVLEEADGVQGYAYGGLHRKRSGYRWSMEVSVYVAAEARGRGVGGGSTPHCSICCAGKATSPPSPGSPCRTRRAWGLYEAMGFLPIGVFRDIGFKLGRWVDVDWWQLPLQEPPSQPASPLPITDLQHELW